MEQEEERKKKIPRRGTISKSTSSFPLDLISEVLLRLPAKSVVRFRCVSKLWPAITSDPYFTNSFKTHHQNSNESNPNTFNSMPICRYQMKSLEHSYFYPTESVHGLICFQDSGKPVLWNPTMRQFLTLPKPEESWEDITCFLGYDPIQGKHKVMCMPLYKIGDECRVLTLGSAQQTWRMIKTNHKHKHVKLSKMENALALIRDDAGVWRDQEGHVCNERGQRLDGQ
ncbi:hypothetical protein EUTSA_v10029487mg, partial [Eutrema salsugineum]